MPRCTPPMAVSRTDFAGGLLRSSKEAAISEFVTAQVRKFEPHLQQLKLFLLEFEDENSSSAGFLDCANEGSCNHGPRLKYLNQLQKIVNRKAAVLKVHVDDLTSVRGSVCIGLGLSELATMQFFVGGKGDDAKRDATIPACVTHNATRYIHLLYEAAEAVAMELVPRDADEGQPEDGEGPVSLDSCCGNLEAMKRAGVPIHLRVPYEIRLIPPSTMKPLSVRQVRAEHVGVLVRMEAVVTKVSTVKPRLRVAYYKCFDCGSNIYQPIEGAEFMPLSVCNSSRCQANQRKGELNLLLPGCKFVKHQQVRVQEPTSRVPPGGIPRTQKMTLEGSLTRQLMPGMTVTVGGVLLPVMKPGFELAARAGSSRGAAPGSSLVVETMVHVQSLDIHKSVGIDLDNTNQQENLERVVEKYRNDPELYDKMARSIAPSIHGMDDVKRTLLLQLVGGVSESFQDGMKLRGDIHVLLIGDPGVAKSQLLGQVCRMAPRAHYTTGKGSSGVGLTASVVRDPLTGDFTLEGGAIVLSDRGICAIDEFDKMDEYDRTAIHEVMEQQTVSISKAGLTATLNARTSILAAANPQYGRYDLKKSPMQNINLQAALLSRFDVQFLLLDKADRVADMDLARHVLRVHQTSASSAGKRPPSPTRAPARASEEFLDPQTVRLLMAKARTLSPKVPSHLIPEIVNYYCELRQSEREQRLRADDYYGTTYTTPRTLLAILRLSQAAARIRFSPVVERGDFEEAVRLVAESRRCVEECEETKRKRRRHGGGDDDVALGEVLDLLKELDRSRERQDPSLYSGWLSLSEAEEFVGRDGLYEKAVAEDCRNL